jgi:hypothetical protein
MSNDEFDIAEAYTSWREAARGRGADPDRVEAEVLGSVSLSRGEGEECRGGGDPELSEGGELSEWLSGISTVARRIRDRGEGLECPSCGGTLEYILDERAFVCSLCRRSTASRAGEDG